MRCCSDRGDLAAGVALTQRHLLGGDGPAAGGHDLAIALDGLLEPGDRGLAHERHVDAVGGAQAIVEVGAHLLAARLLFRRDRAAIGEAAIGIEGTLRQGRLAAEQRDSEQGCSRKDLCSEARAWRAVCRLVSGHSARSFPRFRSRLPPVHRFRRWCQKMDEPEPRAQPPMPIASRASEASAMAAQLSVRDRQAFRATGR